MNNSAYALKNAIVYTLLVGMILLTPLYLYTVYMQNIYEIRNEHQLKEEANTIIKAMEDYSISEKKIFTYPRYLPFPSGLYDRQFKPVFTLIQEPLKTFMPGYTIEGTHSAFVLKLPENRYFKSRYLVITSTISYLAIYQKVLIILIVVISFIFFLSIFFLQRFALPFKRVNQKLDNFIKDTMHEINTPLAIINANIDLYNLRHENNKYLQRIKAATKTLANVYNDMDFLIKSDNVIFVYEDIDFSSFVKERIDYFSEVAALKDIKIRSDIEGGINIHFNPALLQRIIDNNLSNAIKYSCEHQEILISLHQQADASSILTFKDYGIGIADTKNIFTRYYREDREKGGFGIGLNIVKSIIDDAGILLDVQSRPKEGSLFSYTFPGSMAES